MSEDVLTWTLREIRQKIQFIKTNKDIEKYKKDGFPNPVNEVGWTKYYDKKSVCEWLENLNLKKNPHLINKENISNEYEGQRKTFKFTHSAKLKKA